MYAVVAAVVILLLVSLPVAAATSSHADFFVAPNGNDSWSGTRAAPDRARSDGPFATPGRAQQVVRRLKQGQPDRNRPIVVLLRGGTYFLKEPLTFTPEDSGTADAPVVYAAYAGEKPVISGGVRIEGWKRDAEGRWQVTLPEVKGGAWNFTQLFVGGERRSRPRLPKTGYYFIADAAPPSPETQGKGHDRFQYRPGDIRADWTNRDDIEILAFNVWTMPRMHIRSLDTQKNVVTLKGRTVSDSSWASFPRGNRFLVENVKEALSAPGEWYLDRPTGVLTYLARPGEDPKKTVVIAPRLERLVEIKGDAASGRFVERLTFRGLAFAHTNWTLPPNGHTTPQAEVTIDGAIVAEGARSCTWHGCRVTQVGGYAIQLGQGCQHNRIVDGELTDLAAGGVKIGTPFLPKGDEALASHNTVENCLIAHGGRMHPAAVGVWIGHAAHNRIERNTIHDFYYTGISPGWSWGYGKSGAHHNAIAYNHIFDIGQGVLSDMGGIYTLGVSPGTVLHHNRIHDVESLDYGGWGIYFDEGATGIVAHDNVVYRTKSAGFHQHYGKENVVRNNIFAYGREAQLMRTRAEDHLSFTLERNIVYSKDAPLLGSNWSGSNYKLDYNLYWAVGNEPVRFGQMTLEQWREKGQDVHSLVADPLFVDPDKGDFRLKPGSPALRVGFQPIDMSKIGRRTAPQGTPAARDTPVRVMPRAFPPPPPPRPIAEDFEGTEVGAKASLATTIEENAQATIRVTDETAASGKRSLKFVDAAGQQHSYNPHFFYQPKFASGMITGRFDLRMEPGAVFYHEWRDGANPYRVGPSLRVQADGWLLASGQKLLQLPPGRWVRIEIVCGLGGQAAGTYDLLVRLPGRTPPLRYPGLSRDPRFRALRWFGFVADGQQPGVFYLDNIALKPR